MTLTSFVIAKFASLPLMMLYVFIGASAGTLIADSSAIENNSTLIVGGILLSVVMIGIISHYIRKELTRVLDKQKHTSAYTAVSPEDSSVSTAVAADDDGIELGVHSPKAVALQRRHHSTTPPIPSDDPLPNEDAPHKDK